MSFLMGTQLTLWRRKEVEEGVVLYGLHHSALRASAFVLLYLLDNFDRHVLALFPVNCASDATK